MIELLHVLSEGEGEFISGEAVRRWLTLPFEQRQKSRLRARLDDGTECAILLPRGTVLQDGDVLATADGTRVAVRAAAEVVSVARARDELLLLRAAYHLGNRHVPLQISRSELVYLHDHVLDDMLAHLGLSVSSEHAPFNPDPGAYHSHAREAELGSGLQGPGPGHSEPHSHARIKSHRALDESEVPTRVELAKPRRQN